jgi:hypothetical protein
MFTMMLADVPFGNAIAWRDFLQRHAMSHKMVSDAIFRKTGSRIQTVIYPDEGNVQNWLQSNNNAHQEEYDLLGIGGGGDLSGVDLSDQQAYNAWMAQHAMAHQITQNALGL